MILLSVHAKRGSSPSLNKLASQNRDAFLSRWFSINDGSAIAPKVYAAFVMQVKVCAKED